MLHPNPHTSYFRYLHLPPEASLWGVAVTAAGTEHTPPHASYPDPRHPKDHQFQWERGRVMDATQIIFISHGRGIFESQATGPVSLEAGHAALILPGIWHRYRPDPATGWSESWVELHGPLLQSLQTSGILSADAPIRSGARLTGLEDPLNEIHRRCQRNTAPGFDPELSAQAYRLLTLWHQSTDSPAGSDRIATLIAAAERHLSEHVAEAVDLPALAKQLGIAYSHFRRAFKAHTGFAPWQYLLRLRHARARRLLLTSDLTLEEIAQRLGFNTAFHFSAFFKQAEGQSPAQWRKQWPLRHHPGHPAQNV